MTIGEAYSQLSTALQSMYETREAATIADLVIEHFTGFAKSNRLVHKHDVLTEPFEKELQRMKTELLSLKPVQYVLGEAHFYGMTLYVDENVLIPRSETEELIDWIVREEKKDFYREILDIGTGSGCMAIALKKKLPNAEVSAFDVSEKALLIAQKNAALQEANIYFSKVDILNKEQWKDAPVFDCIVSNPPYITRSEAKDMHENVVAFEPQLALFVDDENPLLFYDSIARFGLQHLTENGRLYFEINETYGNEVARLLQQKGYQNVELKKDMQGKDRMIKAELGTA